jgi:DNA-binding MarR family transcriptional regulator
MPDNESAIGDTTATQDDPSKLIKNLALSIAGMNSFLSKLAQLPYFAAAQVQLPEWLILNFLSRNPNLGSIKLSRNLGLSGQRVDAILNGLQGRNWIAKASDEAKGWKLTETGIERLADLEERLTEYFSGSLAGRERALTGLVRSLRVLSQKKKSDGQSDSENADPAD